MDEASDATDWGDYDDRDIDWGGRLAVRERGGFWGTRGYNRWMSVYV